MPRARPWTNSDEDALRAVYEDIAEHGSGRGRLKRLADDLDRSPNAVHQRAHKLGLTGARKHAWTAEDDAALRTLRARGWTVERMAAALQRSADSVRTRLSRLEPHPHNDNNTRCLPYDS